MRTFSTLGWLTCTRLKQVLVAVLFASTSAFAQQNSGGKQTIFEIPQADLSDRYRYIDNTAGVVTSDDMQYRFSGRVRLNLRKTATYVGSRVETGSTFGAGWSDTGIGRSPGQWTMNAKTFFVGHRLGKKAEIEVGAMDFEYGAGSEALYADFDSYTEGYRLRVHDLPGRFARSTIVAHFGYVGDFNTVNSFARLHRLGEINYVQLLAEEKFTKQVDVSAEFNRLRGLHVFRIGAKLTLPGTWWVNDARIETVARMNDGAAAGWAFQLVRSKNRFGRFNPGIYFTHLPTTVYQVGATQALINGDVHGTGKHIGVTAKYQVTKAFDVSTLITRKLDTEPGFRWRAQIVGRYQFADLFRWLP